MKLTPRLQTIADKVHSGSIVADIGTDHGYIPIYLIQNMICPRILAADINDGPLKNAKSQIDLYGYEEFIELRKGNGLEVLKPGEVDTVILAGMGGLLIRDILIANPEVTKSVNRFILQPMTAQSELREWLVENDFVLLDEQLAQEGEKFYEIIVVSNGSSKIYNDIILKIGPKLIENKDPLLPKYIDKQINIQKKILLELGSQKSNHAKEKRNECLKTIFELKEVLRWLSN